MIAESSLASPENVPVLDKELPTGCFDCEKDPMLLREDPTYLFAGMDATNVNGVERACGGIEFAFALSGRPYLASYAMSSEGDSLSKTLIHDLSGKQPKLVFK